MHQHIIILIWMAGLAILVLVGTPKLIVLGQKWGREAQENALREELKSIKESNRRN